MTEIMTEISDDDSIPRMRRPPFPVILIRIIILLLRNFVSVTQECRPGLGERARRLRTARQALPHVTPPFRRGSSSTSDDATQGASDQNHDAAKARKFSFEGRFLCSLLLFYVLVRNN